MQDSIPSSPSNKSLRALAVIGIAIVLIVLIAAIIKLRANKSAEQTQQNTPTFSSEQKDVPNSQLPDKFPQDLPQEAGSKVTQNYNLTTSDGRFQATRTFESKKSLAENMKIYTDYAQKNSWKLGTAIDQKDLKVVSATKDKLNMTVTMSQSLGVNTVNITITEQAAAQ